MKLEKMAILLFLDSFEYLLPHPNYELFVDFVTYILSKRTNHLA